MSPSNWKIGTKIYALLGGLLLLVLVIVGSVWIGLSQIGASATRLYAHNVAGSIGLERAQNALWELRLGIADYQLANADRRKAILADESKWAQSVEEGLRQFGALKLGAEERNAAAELAQTFSQYAKARPHWFELINESNFFDANDYRAQKTDVYGIAAAKLLGEQMDAQQSQMQDVVVGIERQTALVKRLFVLITLAMLALGAGMGVLLARGITRPLEEAVSVAERVAGGDLTVQVRAGSRDEAGRLLASLAKMRDGLVDAVATIRASAESVGATSKELAAGNAELSSRTEEQASSLEETASSMEELTTTVKLNADNARQANQLAEGAAEVAVRGGNLMEDVVATMGGISTASKKIADIIAVIDGIAFQTNILALNAAVEAARAGEQGRGFAVVASEVRALAQRSATAAKEIKQLIGDSVSRVGDGTRLVEGAGRTIQDLVAAAKRVTDVVSEISAASQEQLRGIEQVSQAIMQMDRVVQQNAALVEESSAAAESMSGQAEHLVEAVGRFKLAASASQDPSAGKRGAAAGVGARHNRQVLGGHRPRLGRSGGNATRPEPGASRVPELRGPEVPGQDNSRPR